jgi:hypothetical protein
MATRTLDFEKPFTYVFQDPSWPGKVLLGALFHLLAVVLIGAFVSAGYQKKLFLALIEDGQARLPEFDVSRDLAEGLPVFGIVAVYWLVAAAAGWIPCLGLLFGPLAGLATMVFLPASLTRYYVTGRFSAAFELEPVLAYVKQNLPNLLLYALMGMLVGVLSVVGVLACLVGFFVVSFWGSLVTTRALAEVYRCSQTPLPPPADRPQGW